MTVPLRICLVACGIFFMTGLVTGIWKYRAMLTRQDHQAPMYVNIAHRTALMYSFAALVLAQFVTYSPYSIAVQIAAVLLPIVFFAVAIVTYIVLGLQKATQTQMSERTFATTWGTWLLIAAEIGGFGVLFWGFLTSQVL